MSETAERVREAVQGSDEYFDYLRSLGLDITPEELSLMSYHFLGHLTEDVPHMSTRDLCLLLVALGKYFTHLAKLSEVFPHPTESDDYNMGVTNALNNISDLILASLNEIMRGALSEMDRRESEKTPVEEKTLAE